MRVRKAKSEVAGIYPLSFLQQALLFHSLHKEDDQGFLQIQCFLSGRIRLETFRKSWEQTIDRHESLRTSIHWEDIEKPVQVARKHVRLPFTFRDWSQFPGDEQTDRVAELKISDKKENFDLTKAPVLRINLIKFSEDRYFLLWSCHHILADGWSASIILRDLLAFYDANKNGQVADLPEIPDYKSYLNWHKKQDKSRARSFWKDALQDLGSPLLIGDKTGLKSASKFVYKDLKFSNDRSESLRNLAKKIPGYSKYPYSGYLGIAFKPLCKQKRYSFWDNFVGAFNRSAKR